MKSTTINNAIKEVRELFNELRSNLSCEETKKIKIENNSIKKKLFIIFKKKNIV